MNYEKNYTEYANYVKTLGRSKGQGVYYEEHHIIPKCMGGSNERGEKPPPELRLNGHLGKKKDTTPWEIKRR